jgi:hypothetical protein
MLIRCECGRCTSERCEWTGETVDTVLVEWMPVHLRARHVEALNHGAYPHNGAERLRLSPDCADRLIEADGDWAQNLGQ